MSEGRVIKQVALSISQNTRMQSMEASAPGTLLTALIETMLPGETAIRSVRLLFSPASQEEQEGLLFQAPAHWQVTVLDGDGLDTLRQIKIEEDTDVVLWSSWAPAESLPATTRAEFPGFDLHEAAASILLSRLPKSTRLIWVAPTVTLRSSNSQRKRTRQGLFSAWQPDTVVYARNRNGFLPSVAPSFDFTLTRLVPRRGGVLFTRLFSVPDDESPEAIWTDLAQLIGLRHGETRFGYVLDTTVPPKATLGFSEHHPQRQRSRQQLTAWGKVATVGAFFRILTPPRAVLQLSEGKPSRTTSEDALVIRASDIQMNGELVDDSPEWREATSDELLRAGDMLMREIHHPRDRRGFVVARVPADPPRMTPGRHVIVLRPHHPITDEEADFFLAYLRSATARMLAGVDSFHLQRGRLRALPLPVPNKPTLRAFADLHQAAALFERWRGEALAAANQLFESTDMQAARTSMIDAGHRVRQRALAATALDDLRTRLRTRMPYPIASRWRLVEAAEPALEGYSDVLDCAETLLCYCAVLGISMARHAGVGIAYMTTIRQRLQTARRGMNLGDWTAILHECATRRELRRLPEDTPFAEVRDLLRNNEVEEARRRLATRRNDLAHLRRVRGPELRHAFIEAKADLELLLAAAEWISDYPLRLVTDTRWDSYTRTANTTYRELMGDHAVVPTTVSQLNEHVETGSLYVVDRVDIYHLLRPIVLANTCTICGVFSTFAFDRWDTTYQRPEYRALEHGHSVPRPEQTDALQAVELVPGRTSE